MGSDAHTDRAAPKPARRGSMTTNAFSRTTRSLAAHDERGWFGVVVLGVVLLGAWSAWLLFGSISVFEVSDTARLEVQSAVHPITVATAGRLERIDVTIGQQVRSGDVLAEIDALPERVAVQENRLQRTAFSGRLAALRVSVNTEEAALRAQQSADTLAIEEARASAREAEARAKLAESEAKRIALLRASGQTTEMDDERAQADATAKRASAQALALAPSRIAAEREVQHAERRARVADLERQIADVQGGFSVETARTRELEYRDEQHRIRAPIGGRVGEIADLRVGTVMKAGDNIGSIVPPGDVRAIASFPATSLGRIQQNQRARIRLDGFPWTEYGRLLGRVTRVAREPRDGRLRVELALDASHLGSIQLEHGLPGAVEIEVDRITPLQLVLRSAGRTLR